MYNLETKLQKQFAKDHDKNFIVPNNCVTIIPWIIKSGYRNVTEEGFKEFGTNPDYFSFFQKIFTGNESITAVWEDSTYLTKVENEYKFKYNFQVGKYYAGVPVIGTIEYGADIEEVEGNEDYMSMKSNGTITIRVEGWVPNGEDLYKLYSIPDTPFKARWLYISSVKALNDLQWTEGIDTTNIPVCEITFTTLLDKLQQSGKAVEQYVQYAAPGEPYTFPIVVNRDNNAPEPNEVNQEWVEPVKEVKHYTYNGGGVKYIQIEEQGLAATSAIQVIGRTISRDIDGNYVSSPWKHLLFHDVISPQLNDINKTSLPSKNYYYFPNEVLMYRTSQDFQESIKLMNDAIATNHQAGQFTIGKTADWDGEPSTGASHKSNEVNEAWGTHYDYNSIDWKPLNYTGGSKTDVDTKGNPYSVNILSINKNFDTFVDIMNKQAFMFATQEVLPLGFQNSKPYHISTIPIIGGLVSKFYGDLSINPNTTGKAPINLGYFIDCEAASLLGSIYNNGGQTSVLGENHYCAPVLALAGDEAPKWMGTTACNSTFCFELTDKLIDGKDTIYFGQVRDENGQYLKEDYSAYLYNGQKTVAQKDYGFIIDYVIVQSIFNGKIKVSCYNGQMSTLFTTTVLSKSHWTESIRDWTTTIKTGCWPIEFCRWSERDWPWPETSQKDIYNNWPVGYEAKNYDNEEEVKQYNWQISSRGWLGGSYEGSECIDTYRDNSTGSYHAYPIEPFEEETHLGADWFAPEKAWVTTDGYEETFNIDYSEIDSTTTSKADFFRKYKALKIDFNTSQLRSNNDQDPSRGQEITASCDLSSQYTLNFSDISGDTFTADIQVNGLGVNNGGTWLPGQDVILDDQNIRRNYTCCMVATDLAFGDIWYEGGCVTRVRVTFTFGENNITFVAKDITQVFKGDRVSQWRTGFTTRGTLWREGLKYNIHIPKIDFIPGEIPKPSPTGYDLFGGSEILFFTDSSGVDSGIWKLYNEGEEVTPDTWSLEYVTMPPGLGPFRMSSDENGAIISWVAGSTLDYNEIDLVARIGDDEIRKRIYCLKRT